MSNEYLSSGYLAGGDKLPDLCPNPEYAEIAEQYDDPIAELHKLLRFASSDLIDSAHAAADSNDAEIAWETQKMARELIDAVSVALPQFAYAAANAAYVAAKITE